MRVGKSVLFWFSCQEAGRACAEPFAAGIARIGNTLVGGGPPENRPQLFIGGALFGSSYGSRFTKSMGGSRHSSLVTYLAEPVAE
jgi:hypothetical protein